MELLPRQEIKFLRTPAVFSVGLNLPENHKKSIRIAAYNFGQKKAILRTLPAHRTKNSFRSFRAIAQENEDFANGDKQHP